MYFLESDGEYSFLNRPIEIVPTCVSLDQVRLSSVLQGEIAHRVESEASQNDDGGFRMPRSWNELDQNLKTGHIRQAQFDNNAVNPLRLTHEKACLACLSFEDDIIRG